MKKVDDWVGILKLFTVSLIGRWIVKSAVLWGIILMGAAWASAEMRTWTARNGQTIEAEYVRDAAGKVWIRPVNGKVRAVPTAALSEDDQQYIYKQTLPKITVHVDDDISRSTVGSDIDNVAEEIRCTVEIRKTSHQPYPVDYEMLFFMLGMNIRRQEYYIAEKKIETFALVKKNDIFSFNGKLIRFEHDPDPPRGTRYEGYLLCVRTAEGKMLATKGRDKYLKQLNKLINSRVRSARFTKDFLPLKK